MIFFFIFYDFVHQTYENITKQIFTFDGWSHTCFCMFFVWRIYFEIYEKLTLLFLLWKPCYCFCDTTEKFQILTVLLIFPPLLKFFIFVKEGVKKITKNKHGLNLDLWFCWGRKFPFLNTSPSNYCWFWTLSFYPMDLAWYKIFI